MITGIIKNGRATVNVIFRLENQPDFTIEFVIDTGFTEFLSFLLWGDKNQCRQPIPRHTPHQT